jgi:hypothetical protein
VNIVWLLLGVLLIALVASMIYAFFVLRPRLARQVQSSVAIIAEELHGREPLSIVPARCEGVSDSARATLVGVGSLALTEHGVIFGAGDPPRSLIIARDRISAATAEKTFAAAASTVRKRDAMLVIRWKSAGDNESAVAFTVADPGAFVAELGQSRENLGGA